MTSIDIADLSGCGFARGLRFGISRREQIHRWIDAWHRDLEKAGVGDPLRYLEQMLHDTRFLSAISRHTPELLEEVRGLADGAALAFDIVFAAQLMDEEWAYRPAALRRGEPLQKCSSVALAAGDGHAWIGQNMDLGAYTDGHQVLLRSGDGGTAGSLIFTVGGMLALMGVNAHGLGVCVNSLPQLPFAREGLPVTFVIRRLLQASSAHEAAQVVRSLPHATGQHYLLADADSIRSFEASSSEVVEYHPPDPSRLMHTNHPLAHAEAYSSGDKTNSIARLRALMERLMSGRPNAESIKAALSSSDDPEHPVCRVATPASKMSPVTGTINFTTGSMVCALARAAPIACWVSAGPPATRGYAELRLGRRF